jgi:hypothetical protein
MPALPMLRRSAIALLIAGLVLPAALFSQTPPETFLGHAVGADRKLADYDQIKAYFRLLDSESPKLKLLEIGTSTLGKPMIMAVITSEDNMARLDEYRETARKLKMARGLTDDDARRLARDGKVIVTITCSLHATEIAASQMAMEFAYDLVTGKAFFDIEAALRDVIVLLIPTSNPDGHQMVTEWYRKYVGTPFEGGNMPWLYHHYAGHNNNRDWFMFNLAETRAVSRVLYHDWFPQIHIDEHQMGSTGARLFIPPYQDPPQPNVHPLIWRGINLLGTTMAYDLQSAGFQGIENSRIFTGWWIGACNDTSWLHNTVGILSEMASVRIASPIYIEPTEVPQSYVERRMHFIDPWPGGWWRLRDLVDYELTLTKSLVRTAALYKDDFLLNSYRAAKFSIETTEKDQPFAFVIPAEQRDMPTTRRMLGILMFGGIEIHKAEEPFHAGGRYYPAGSFVVLMAQPFKPYAKALLEKQRYPDLREYPGGPPIPPYDNAGWTLPLQMGVACDEIKTPFEARLTKLESAPANIPEVPDGPPYLLFDARSNASYAVIFGLLKKNVEVWRTAGSVVADGFEAAPGSFIVGNTPEIGKALSGLLEKWPIEPRALKSIDGLSKAAVKNPRIGVYRSWRSNMDEGWVRYIFDDMGVSYTTLRNSDFKAEKGKKVDFRASYDVIIFASENPDVIKSGRPGAGSEFARYMTPMPSEYEGGIEKEGVDALKAFVEKGGILAANNQASNFILREFPVPARNAVERIDRTRFFCPTSILKLDVDPTTPIGYGLAEMTPAVFSGSLAMDTWVPPMGWDRKVVASFPERNILLSGWLLGEEEIARKAAVVDVSHKNGRIILIGIAGHHRGQSHGTFKFLLNTLLYPQAN